MSDNEDGAVITATSGLKNRYDSGPSIAEQEKQKMYKTTTPIIADKQQAQT